MVNKFRDMDLITEYDFFHEVRAKKSFNPTTKKSEIINYVNLPISYDIETSSFRNENGHPVAITYAHALNVDGNSFLGRTWYTATEAFNFMADMFGLGESKRAIVYIHNLSYEFQFLKKRFRFVEVSSNGSERKIMRAVTDRGIEFRCSLFLTNTNLKNVAKNLTRHKIEKMVGDIDHTLIRTPQTPLSDKELGYILNDVVILEYLIRESMEEQGDNILNIPLTNTGYVRKHFRKLTIEGKEKSKVEYRKLIRSLTLEPVEYMALREAFSGGLTHANARYAGKTVHGVESKDFASSYPARTITYQYPMGKGEIYHPTSPEDLKKQLENYCCLLFVRMKEINCLTQVPYISFSKARRAENPVLNNGRIEACQNLEMWMTDVDLKSVMSCYEVTEFDVPTLYRYKRGYLPTEFIKGIVELYKDKTMLKNLSGYEDRYKKSKEMLNSTYGMCVTDIARSTFEWVEKHKSSVEIEVDLEETVDKENRKRNRFLFYPWGVWITAYARYDLYKEVLELGDRFVYCDTDSIYYKPDEFSEEVFRKSNQRITELLHKACEHHGMGYEELAPKDRKGITRVIGLWEHDGSYVKFKSLGAKRYMVEDASGNVEITVSGVNKSTAIPYLKEHYDDLFDAFREGLIIPEGACGKLTHTYVDDCRVGEVTDYLGDTHEYEELSSVHLEETSYSMTISNEYREFIEWIENGRPRR